MNRAFKSSYAKYYDLIYEDKDYEKECDFLEEIFSEYSEKPIKSILDGGCGTGGHAISLAKRGYSLLGFDASEIMVKRAKEKAKNCDGSVVCCVGDLRDFQFSETFDTCILMFAVIDYITETEDVLKTLKNVRKHLRENSLFIFDFWNGLAVLRILPSVRVKEVENKKAGIRIIRTVEPELDTFNHISKSHYRLIVLKNDRVIDEVEEIHVIRFYFPQEIKHYLEDANFEVLKICPFLDLDGKVDDNVWNIAVIARAVGGKK